ncbi:citrate (Si)-synthase [Halosquirtibacter xylanolyticus]|uniref:citrate (Si)-synthase n=1 Tax=Halosquirtibacter xylanolyticus TaxID=3374599 RepID=UPI0037483C4E|nr:citrate (Si)-synthase [Prolixibacteraceae bacterium]
MDYIKQRLFEKGSEARAQVQELLSSSKDLIVDEVTIGHVLGGMRGVTSLLTLTSKLDPYEGIRYRGFTLPELYKVLPRKNPEGEPLAEGVFFLLLTGDVPTIEEVEFIRQDWVQRSNVPDHVFRTIDALPSSSKPMTRFSTAILASATQSQFQKKHRNGLRKEDYWDSTYEDVMNMIAQLPVIASYIYRKEFEDGKVIALDPDLDWSANFAHMMGFDSEEIYRLFRMYMYIHADHEGGNVSAHTAHLVASALSNPFYSYSAGMIGLAGPLHGYANQDVVRWIFDMYKHFDRDIKEQLTEDEITSFVNITLDSGKVVPGYGHAVLRATDPRFTTQMEFADKYVSSDSIVDTAKVLYKVVPQILLDRGKAKNPWPNVDAFSGSLLMHYGIKDYIFYTVMFGVSRALGVGAQLIWDRFLGLPIERPNSQTLDWLIDFSKSED